MQYRPRVDRSTTGSAPARCLASLSGFRYVPVQFRMLRQSRVRLKGFTMKVLFATDGSDFSISSLEFLARLPFPEGSEMSVMSVVPDLESVTGGHTSAERGDVQEAARMEATRVLQQTFERASSLGLPVSRTVLTGNAAGEIIEHGVRTETDLAVVGSHGRRGFKQFLLGSVSLKVVTYAPFSVLIVRPVGARGSAGDGRSEALRVLVATDGSEHSNAAIVQFAALAARRWCTSKVVTVMELVTVFRMDIRQRLNESWRQRKAGARQHLKDTAEALDSLAIEVETQVLEAASASEAILDAADAFRSTLSPELGRAVLYGQKLICPTGRLNLSVKVTAT